MSTQSCMFQDSKLINKQYHLRMEMDVVKRLTNHRQHPGHQCRAHQIWHLICPQNWLMVKGEQFYHLLNVKECLKSKCCYIIQLTKIFYQTVIIFRIICCYFSLLFRISTKLEKPRKYCFYGSAILERSKCQYCCSVGIILSGLDYDVQKLLIKCTYTNIRLT